MTVRTIGQKIINIVFYALLIMISAIIILTLLGNKDKKVISFGSFSMFTVLTGSMSPTFDAGSIIITKKTDAKRLQAGDILTYKQNGSNTLVTHRIVEVIHDNMGYSYITKGDANNVEDALPIPYENAIGRVIFWANGIGTIFLYFRTVYGISFIVVVVLLLILASFLYDKLRLYLSNESGKGSSER